jgi:Gpi18-like mannosyltransferase
VLRHKIHWAWLAVIPVVYLAIAAPALALGQPLRDILTVYLKQAGTFERLSMNAANLWLFVPNQFYEAGVTMGLAVSAAAGLAFSIAVARVKIQLKTEHIVVAAALSLLLMPLLLPKMHDRYFYAFEVMAVVLAFMKPRLAVIAVAAQIDGVLAYLAYYGVAASWLRLAALGNVWILVELGQYAWRKFKEPRPPDATAFSVMTFVVGLGAFWIISLLIA